jgi:hypothetical protein
MSGAESVEVGTERPASYFVSNGNVLGTDGGGCGYYGYFGTRQNAVNDLKNKAAQIGADYVQVISEQGSYKSMSCETNLYKVSAVAYKEDPVRKKEFEDRLAASQEMAIRKEQDEARRLMVEFMAICKNMGFKPDSDGMGMCLLAQQNRHDAALGRLQQQQLAEQSLTAQSQADYRRHIAEQEAAHAARLAQDAAVMQGVLQNGINSAFPAAKTTNCNVYGNSINCIER